MSSSSNSWSGYKEQVGQGIEDNGAKWGSHVKRNPDGSFPFDEKMKTERPSDWDQMIEERVAPLYETMRNPPRRIPKRWAQGRTKPRNH